jgi:hypothetical protein
MRLISALMLFLVVAAWPLPLPAQSLAQKQMMARQDEEFAQAVPPTDKACGTTLKAAIDWPGFLSAEIGQNSISAFCAGPLNTMASMCSDPTAKKAIAEKVKSYTCRFGGPGKRALALQNGELSMDVDWDAANYDDFVRAWLGDHL